MTKKAKSLVGMLVFLIATLFVYSVPSALADQTPPQAAGSSVQRTGATSHTTLPRTLTVRGTAFHKKVTPQDWTCTLATYAGPSGSDQI